MCLRRRGIGHYGTRGTNGVILVTTRKAAKTVRCTLPMPSLYRGIKKKELDMMSADDFRKVRLAWGDTGGGDLGGNYDWLDGVSRTRFLPQAHDESFGW